MSKVTTVQKVYLKKKLQNHPYGLKWSVTFWRGINWSFRASKIEVKEPNKCFVLRYEHVWHQAKSPFLLELFFLVSSIWRCFPNRRLKAKQPLISAMFVFILPQKLLSFRTRISNILRQEPMFVPSLQYFKFGRRTTVLPATQALDLMHKTVQSELKAILTSCKDNQPVRNFAKSIVEDNNIYQILQPIGDDSRRPGKNHGWVV